MVKIPSFVKKFSALEIILLVALVVYLVFNVQTPDILSGYINTPIGIVVVLVLALCLFLYTNPVLGILGLFVAFEIIRRSNVIAPVSQVTMIQYTPPQIKKDDEMVKMNPKPITSLEEEVVAQLAPLGVSEPASYITTSFRPVSENIHNASVM
jgi:hypothetical protein